MSIRIEPIQESDFEALNTLFKEFSEFEKLPHLMTNTVEQMKEEKEYLKGFTLKNEENTIVGYATYFFTYFTWKGKSLYMDDLYICPEYRGKGLGSLLIDAVISHAKNERCNKIRWQVSNWNTPAIEFYKKLGAEISPVEMNCDITV